MILRPMSVSKSIVLLVALTAASCGPAAEQNPPARADSAGATPATTANRGHYWELPVAIASLKSSHLYALGEDSVDFLVSHTQRRKCASGACDVTIAAVANQNPGPTNIGAHGAIVARLENKGDNGNTKGIESRYKIPKGGGGTFAHYLIAFPDPSVPELWRWAVYEARKNAASNVMATPVPGAAGTWTHCTHGAGSHPKDRAQFRHCSSVAATGTSTGTTTGAVVLNPGEEPGWLSCSAGCCTAGQ